MTPDEGTSARPPPRRHRCLSSMRRGSRSLRPRRTPERARTRARRAPQGGGRCWGLAADRAPQAMRIASAASSGPTPGSCGTPGLGRSKRPRIQSSSSTAIAAAPVASPTAACGDSATTPPPSRRRRLPRRRRTRTAGGRPPRRQERSCGLTPRPVDSRVFSSVSVSRGTLTARAGRASGDR